MARTVWRTWFSGESASPPEGILWRQCHLNILELLTLLCTLMDITGNGNNLYKQFETFNPFNDDLIFKVSSKAKFSNESFVNNIPK